MISYFLIIKLSHPPLIAHCATGLDPTSSDLGPPIKFPGGAKISRGAVHAAGVSLLKDYGWEDPEFYNIFNQFDADQIKEWISNTQMTREDLNNSSMSETAKGIMEPFQLRPRGSTPKDPTAFFEAIDNSDCQIRDILDLERVRLQLAKGVTTEAHLHISIMKTQEKFLTLTRELVGVHRN